jgi:DNA-binding transcriptional LysR family regulator
VTAVADGSIDLGIVDSPTPHPGVQAAPFRRSVAHCVLWAGHPLSRCERITPGDLAEIPLVTVTRRFSARAQLDRAFADAGIEPLVVLEATTSAFVTALVRVRMGVTIINPFPLAFSEAADLVFRPFAPAIPFETCFIMPSTGATVPVARRFADFVRAEQADDALTMALR